MKAFLKSAIAAGVMALMSFNIHAQNFTPVVSPVVHEDNTVTFNYLVVNKVTAPRYFLYTRNIKALT